MVNKWAEDAHVTRYLGHADTLPHRSEGEAVVVELLPPTVGRVLNLGTGDGRLLAAVLSARPALTAGVGVDMSPPMLAAARARFATERRVAVVDHNMDAPLPAAALLAAADAAAAAGEAAVGDDPGVAGRRASGATDGTGGGAGGGGRLFDVVVSSFAIHHLSDARKRAVYAEAAALLAPGGTLINLEHVASPTAGLHAEFLGALGVPVAEDDPSNVLAPVAPQLAMLADAGLADVDCFWKWREMALLAGRKPPSVAA